MEIENKRLIYRNALKLFGYDKQMLMLVEECGELLNSIAKMERGRVSAFDVIDELADVSIMVEQIAVFYGWDDFIERKSFKINRLKDRIEKHQKKAVQ